MARRPSIPRLVKRTACGTKVTSEGSAQELGWLAREKPFIGAGDREVEHSIRQQSDRSPGPLRTRLRH
jgi:hypothetical protein